MPGEILVETDKYWKVKFTPQSLLTVGSQGFLVRRELMMQVSWKPYLYHMDTNMELVQKGFDTYIMLKYPVIHDHSKDFNHFIGKLKRNISLLYSENEYRKYKYDMSKAKMIKLGLIMGIPIIPLIDAMKGFVKLQDLVWFMHPVLCFQVAAIYTINTLKNMLKKQKRKV